MSQQPFAATSHHLPHVLNSLTLLMKLSVPSLHPQPPAESVETGKQILSFYPQAQ